MVAYLRAVLRHWTAGLTGGVAAAVLTAWAVTGNAISPLVGIMFVVGALLAAPYRAWRESQMAVEAHRARLTALLNTAPRIKLMQLALDLGTPRRGDVKVSIANPGETTSFPDGWGVTIRGTDGKATTLLTDRMVLHGHASSVAPAGRTEGYIPIPESSAVPGPLPATGAHIRVATHDIRGFEVAAEGFLGPPEAMPDAEGFWIWPISCSVVIEPGPGVPELYRNRWKSS